MSFADMIVEVFARLCFRFLVMIPWIAVWALAITSISCGILRHYIDKALS